MRAIAERIVRLSAAPSRSTAGSLCRDRVVNAGGDQLAAHEPARVRNVCVDRVEVDLLGASACGRDDEYEREPHADTYRPRGREIPSLRDAVGGHLGLRQHLKGAV